MPSCVYNQNTDSEDGEKKLLDVRILVVSYEASFSGEKMGYPLINIITTTNNR
jgi:hypothetical protein